MKFRIHIPQAVAFAMIPLGVLNYINGYRHLMAGDATIAALDFTAALMVTWAVRMPAHYALTRFCLWWIHRQVKNAHLVIQQVNMQASKQENKKDEID